MSDVFVPDNNAAIVRYQVGDLERSLRFYTDQLGFRLVQRGGPVLIIARGNLHVLLSSPGASGGRPMRDGTQQGSGGWNRIVLYVEDLEASIGALEKAHAQFRNAIESGPGGRQILLDDPDGNPIELHEAPKEQKPMKRTFTLILAVLAAVALFGGLVYAVLVAAHVSEPAATTVYGLTPRRFWATAAAGLALVGAIIGGLAMRQSAGRIDTSNGRLGAIVALAAGLIAVANGGLNLALATGGPGTGNGVVGGAAALVLGVISMALGGLALDRSRRTANPLTG